MMRRFKKFWPKTLKTKLRLSLFAIGFFPFVLMLGYMHNLGKKKILDDTITLQHAQMQMIKRSIEQQMGALKKEITFLASLEMMNDMIAADVDKRIAHLLQGKQNDIGGDVNLFALNTEDAMVASTLKVRQKKFVPAAYLHRAVKNGKGHFLYGEKLYLFAPIVSTLQNGMPLGYLVLAYPLENLKGYFVRQKGVRTLFSFPQSALKIGETFDSGSLKLGKYGEDDMREAYLVLQERFEGVLSGGFLVYEIKKSVALSFLEQFILLLWGLFIFGVLFITLFSWWIGKHILKPIHTLSDATRSIVSTQDYTTQVSVSSEGEINDLALNFNRMIQEINRSFQRLEEENRVRLLRFVQLVNIFNRLIQTESEEACIALALDELKMLVPDHAFRFSPVYPKEEGAFAMQLYVKDFEKGTSHFYGSIVLSGGEAVNDGEEIRFYRAIGTMIMLQLDQIRLIAQTKAVSSAKSTFISHMSHELRTPLHTILSATQYMLSYETLSPPQQEKIATIESSADHLLGMINDILDLVQIEASKVSVHAERLSSSDIEKSMEEILSMLGVLAEEKGLVLRFENSLFSAVEAIADRKYLKQILINLLSNAIKFTEEGYINVSMQQCGEALCIVIKDSGIGLSETDRKHLFDEFAQFADSTEGKQRGSGLGLAISKKLAKLFDAELTLKSEGPGQGTEAVLALKCVNY